MVSTATAAKPGPMLQNGAMIEAAADGHTGYVIRRLRPISASVMRWEQRSFARHSKASGSTLPRASTGS